tara:strand:+ start:263 stop:727 length:465 start_codon:yes stop_codon:yes gene_type:complete
MRLLLLLLTIIPILSFRIPFKRYNKFTFNAESNDHNKLPKVINVQDLTGLVYDIDEEVLKKLNEVIPTAPKCEEEIEQDSFEGYLQMHFNLLKNNENKIDFERFLSWRKQIGTFLTKDELFSIYNGINENNEYCDLMNFILINKIIDEIDGADL